MTSLTKKNAFQRSGYVRYGRPLFFSSFMFILFTEPAWVLIPYCLVSIALVTLAREHVMRQGAPPPRSSPRASTSAPTSRPASRCSSPTTSSLTTA